MLFHLWLTECFCSAMSSRRVYRIEWHTVLVVKLLQWSELYHSQHFSVKAERNFLHFLWRINLCIGLHVFCHMKCMKVHLNFISLSAPAAFFWLSDCRRWYQVQWLAWLYPVATQSKNCYHDSIMTQLVSVYGCWMFPTSYLGQLFLGLPHIYSTQMYMSIVTRSSMV